MSNKKRGFSLAELLIALAIISIIATMGLTIGKKSVAKAYENYIYEGYKAFYDAICHTKALEIPEVNDTEDGINPAFITELKNIFSDYEAGNTINTVNGIKYSIIYNGQSSASRPDGDPPRLEHIITIKMSIPYVRRKNSNTADICLALLSDEIPSILIPYSDGPNCKTSEEFSNIQVRKDLLSFYIQIEGDIAGNTHLKDTNGDGQITREDYVPIQYYSPIVAICKNVGGASSFMNTDYYIYKCPNPELPNPYGTLKMKVKKK